MKCDDIRDDLALRPYGELDPIRRQRIEEHLGSCPACAARAREFDDVKEYLDMATLALPSADLNARVQAAIEAAPRTDRYPLLSRLKGALRPRWSRVAATVVPVAALLGIWWFFGRSRSALAWVDVIRAMNALQQFHVKVFGEVEGGSEKIEIDIYFKQPNTWRASGMGYVQFASNGSVKLFDVTKRGFVDPETTKEKPLPPDFSRGDLQRHGLLKGLLTMFFRSKLPPGQPVRTPVVKLSRDLEVFDYAHDGFRQWVRVWVLKASRLPIRMTVCYPQSDEHMKCFFDYSSPQPDRFFDVDAFIGEVNSKHLRKVRHIYRAGLAPVAGKPRTPTQIHDMRGYEWPSFKGITADQFGNLEIVAIAPRNKAPAGWDVSGAYWHELRDNWGNVYVRSGWICKGGSREMRQWYVPVRPLRTGAAPHTITLRYWVEVRTKIIKVTEEAVEVPVPTRTKLVEENSLGRVDALLRHLRSAGPLSRLWEQIDVILARDPANLRAFQDKEWLLSMLGREDEAYVLFQTQFLDAAIAGSARSDICRRALLQYLCYLVEKGRRDEIEPILGRLKAVKRKALDVKDKRRRRWAADRLRSRYCEWLLDMPKTVRAFDSAKKPKVVEALASRDGFVYVRYRRPRLRSRVSYGEWRPLWEKLSPSWWHVASSSERRDPQIQWLIVEGKGDELPLATQAPFIFDDRGEPSRWIDWTFRIPVPTPTVERMADRFPDALDAGARPSWWEAEGLHRAGEYERGLAAFREIRDSTSSKATGEGHDPWLERRASAGMAKCLVKLGRLDGAQALLDEVERDRPSVVDVDDPRERDKLMGRWRATDLARLVLREERRGASPPMVAE